MINVWFWHTLVSAMAITAGYRIAQRAWRKLRRLQISIELLVTVAITGALLLGEFTEAGAVAVLFILGEQLEAHALRRTRLALSNLVDLLPEKATILKDGAPVEVAPDELRTGDVLLVREGARVPADGKVLKGQAARLMNVRSRENLYRLRSSLAPQCSPAASAGMERFG